MLPALLAGAGILIVAGLLIFGGDDEDKTAKREGTGEKSQSANVQTNSGGAQTGVAARQTDEATPAAGKAKLNPRIANSIVTGGMSPTSEKKEDPTSFASKNDEITYWEDQLREAERLLEIRERAVDHIPKTEQAIREGNDPENGLKEFEKRKKVVQENLDKAQKRVEDIEAKLEELRG